MLTLSPRFSKLIVLSVFPDQGDTGGALIFTEADGSLTHVAVASFTPGKGCGLGMPSGFTRTASYIDWISSIVDDITNA